MLNRAATTTTVKGSIIDSASWVLLIREKLQPQTRNILDRAMLFYRPYII